MFIVVLPMKYREKLNSPRATRAIGKEGVDSNDDLA
jgi:hypothetical protein